MTKEELIKNQFPNDEFLQSSVLQIVDKCVADLEKENAELKETCNKWFEHLKNREEELLNELNNQNAKYESQIEELEKENAELKAKATSLENVVRSKEQLTKAKEIIKGFLEANNGIDMFNAQWNAEQFLKEVSE